MTKKILITGSREFSNVQIMKDALNAEVIPGEDVIVVHGAARGADTIADKLAVASSVATVVRVPADWENRPRWQAGPVRNEHMLDLGPDVVLAFYQKGAANKGTKNCVQQAKDRHILVKEFWSE